MWLFWFSMCDHAGLSSGALIAPTGLQSHLIFVLTVTAIIKLNVMAELLKWILLDCTDVRNWVAIVNNKIVKWERICRTKLILFIKYCERDNQDGLWLISLVLLIEMSIRIFLCLPYNIIVIIFLAQNNGYSKIKQWVTSNIGLFSFKYFTSSFYVSLCTISHRLCGADYYTKWVLNPNWENTAYCEWAMWSSSTWQMIEPF